MFLFLTHTVFISLLHCKWNKQAKLLIPMTPLHCNMWLGTSCLSIKVIYHYKIHFWNIMSRPAALSENCSLLSFYCVSQGQAMPYFITFNVLPFPNINQLELRPTPYCVFKTVWTHLLLLYQRHRKTNKSCFCASDDHTETKATQVNKWHVSRCYFHSDVNMANSAETESSTF